MFSAATAATPSAGTIGWQYAIPAGGGYERSFVSATAILSFLAACAALVYVLILRQQG